MTKESGRSLSPPLSLLRGEFMTGGFSFCGTDIASIGLVYVPETSSMYAPYSGATFNVNASTDGTGNGGYFYGTTLKPKEFTLRCLFEDHDVRNGIVSKVMNLFKRGRTGKLVFKTYEWLWWNATVTNVVDTTKFTNYMNGFITITLTAYYPFARSDIKAIPDFNTNNDDRTLETIKEEFETAWTNACMGNARAVSIPQLSDEKNTALSEAKSLIERIRQNSEFITITRMPHAAETDERLVYIYNGGTERACCAIKIQGDFTDGIVFKNKTTGQECTIQGIDTGTKEIIVDSLNGKVVLHDPTGNETTNAYLYHRGGFIDLAPCGGLIRDIPISTGENARTFTIRNNVLDVDESFIGKFVTRASSNMKKIVNVDNGVVTLDGTLANARSTVDIVDQMNEILITKKGSSTIDSIEFIYRPAFR